MSQVKPSGPICTNVIVPNSETLSIRTNGTNRKRKLLNKIFNVKFRFHLRNSVFKLKQQIKFCVKKNRLASFETDNEHNFLNDYRN